MAQADLRHSFLSNTLFAPAPICQCQSDRGAAGIDDQRIHPAGMPAGYKRLVEFIREGIHNRQKQRQPPGAFLKTQTVPVCQRQQSIPQHMPALFDEQVR